MPPSTIAFRYMVTNGWVLYSESDATATRIWSRSPTGTLVLVGTVTSPLLIFEGLGPAGQLVYRTNDRRYVAVLSGGSYATTDIGNATLGTAFWLNGQLFVAIGGTLLQASF